MTLTEAVKKMQPGTMVVVGEMLMASFPLNHELMWTADPIFIDEGRAGARGYCRCGWVAPPDQTAAISRSQFVNHLEEPDATS